MAVIYPFPPPKKAQKPFIPTPANYTPDAKYFVVDMAEYGDLSMIVSRETKIIVREGLRVSGNFHAIRTPDGTAISTLIFLEDGRVLAEPVHEGAPSGVFGAGDLDIIGSAEELYPRGWAGGCWCWFERREMVGVSADLPLISAK